jgi:hypothetical protein
MSTRITKYYHLICNEGDQWVDVFGSYTRKEVVEEWDGAYAGYTHPSFDDVWRQKHRKIISTDGSLKQLVVALEAINEGVQS